MQLSTTLRNSAITLSTKYYIEPTKEVYPVSETVTICSACSEACIACEVKREEEFLSIDIRPTEGGIEYSWRNRENDQSTDFTKVSTEEFFGPHGDLMSKNRKIIEPDEIGHDVIGFEVCLLDDIKFDLFIQI